MIAVVNPDKRMFGCKKCRNFADFSEVRVPYACKLFMQELQCMSIAPRLITEKVYQEKSLPGINYDQ